VKESGENKEIPIFSLSRGIFREFRTKSSGSRYAATDALTGNRFCTLGSVAGSVEEDKRDQSETKEKERAREREREAAAAAAAAANPYNDGVIV